MRGIFFCLLSAACFATLGIFGQLAGDAGANIPTLLLVRFALAAAAFWVLARGLPAVRGLPRRTVVTGLALGAIGYSAQAVLFFAAIDRMAVPLASLLLYTYPAFVTVAAIALGRAQASARVAGALAVASAGLALVLLAAGSGAFDALGAVFAVGAALTYTTYILVSENVVATLQPFALSALVLTGGTVTFAVFGAASGSIELALSGEAWLWLVLIALVSTVIAVSAFFAGLRRVGSSEAAILSTFEPPVTVLLAYLALGETLTVVQLAGGALVLGAVIVLQRSRRTFSDGAGG